jgi:hypothetical protein
MAFRRLLFNRVESDAGFRVKVRTFKSYVEYREEKRVAKIPVDRVLGEVTVNVYSNTIVVWKPPHSSEVVSEEKRMEILKNVVDAMRFLHYSAEFVEMSAESKTA